MRAASIFHSLLQRQLLDVRCLNGRTTEIGKEMTDEDLRKEVFGIFLLVTTDQCASRKRNDFHHHVFMLKSLSKSTLANLNCLARFRLPTSRYCKESHFFQFQPFTEKDIH